MNEPRAERPYMPVTGPSPRRGTRFAAVVVGRRAPRRIPDYLVTTWGPDGRPLVMPVGMGGSGTRAGCGSDQPRISEVPQPPRRP
jgi:hypothetical protein